jgi:general secretion pathway protein L
MRVFFSWWFAQLAGLLPDIVTRVSIRSTDAAIIEIDSRAASLLLRSNGTATCIARASLSELGLGELARVVATQDAKPSLLLLRLPAEQVLQKHLSLPLAARRDLANALGFEIDRETPFTRDEVYWTYVVRSQDKVRGRLDVDLLIVPRSFADSFIESARRAGLEPDGIEVGGDGNGSTLIPLGSGKRIRIRAEWPLIPLAAAAGAIALVAIAVPFAGQQWEIASADAALASLEAPAKEAGALRRSADQLALTNEFLKSQGQHYGRTLATLAAVTRALPDESYLTALTLRAGRLTMTGLSNSAAELVGLFAKAPEFREPTFDSPVVGSENGDQESFTLSVNLAPMGSP